MSNQYLIQGDNIIIVVKGKSFTVSKSHINYSGVLEAINDENWLVLEDLVDPKQMVVKHSGGSLTIKGDQIFWKEVPVNNSLTKRLVQMIAQNFPIKSFVLFMENLMENPSYRAVNELYSFLEKNSLPITSDGHFLAYKKIRDDYTDVHTGTIDNSVGRVISMFRSSVNDDKQSTCSAGLHFCSEEYLKSFSGDRLVVLKINPRDVVSIPVDYNNSKGRCCEYTVIAEVTGQKISEVFTSIVMDTVGKVDEDISVE